MLRRNSSVEKTAARRLQFFVINTLSAKRPSRTGDHPEARCLLIKIEADKAGAHRYPTSTGQQPSLFRHALEDPGRKLD
jgi:hypothetical protein